MQTTRRAIITMTAALAVLLPGAPAAAQSIGPPEVVLIDPGEEPRRLLRYRLTEGSSAAIVLAMDQDMRMSQGGLSGPWFDAPTVTMTLTNTVLSVDADGIAELESTATGAEVANEGDPSVVEAMADQMATLDGMRTRTRMDDRGRVLEAETTFPAGYVAPPGVQPGQFDTQARQLAQPLPAEPVGQGAVWEVRATTDAGGFDITTVSRVTLRSLTDDGFTATVDVVMEAPAQAWDIPGVPAGINATLDGMRMDGSSDLAVDLTRFLVTSSVEMSGGFAFTIDAPDESITTEAEMRMRVELVPADG